MNIDDTNYFQDNFSYIIDIPQSEATKIDFNAINSLDIEYSIDNSNTSLVETDTYNLTKVNQFDSNDDSDYSISFFDNGEELIIYLYIDSVKNDSMVIYISINNVKYFYYESFFEKESNNIKLELSISNYLTYKYIDIEIGYSNSYSTINKISFPTI